MVHFRGALGLVRELIRAFGAAMEKKLVQLRDQIQRQDASGAAFVLHTIKGSSGTMGAK